MQIVGSFFVNNMEAYTTAGVDKGIEDAKQSMDNEWVK